jgi:cyclopropane fatty-acyl-phospholipid synthase-like methyltransferase
MRLTKKTLVLEIVKTATKNVEGAKVAAALWLVETIASKNYAFAIQEWYDAFKQGKKTAEDLVDEMIDQTYMNSLGVNGMTDTCKAIMRMYYIVMN